MSPGPWQLIIILVIVLVLFGGRGKISALMGDFGKGLKSFKKGMKADDDVADDEEDAKVLKSEQTKTAEPEAKKDDIKDGAAKT
ncbi:MAG: twin-arginine translocase TatA/TatE family subunit [Proteobacteria bacterium]|nr:twin-arginine translocase TatA/TatE family subunit [Pseudomonadota bacterium]MDA1022642.1 twin-arginine translocase TatA/TatE family subunit [Pseudomonadota bacterium]